MCRMCCWGHCKCSIVPLPHKFIFMTSSTHAVPLGGVENIQSLPYGPRNMFIVWDRLSEDILRGDEDSQLFFASLDPVTSVHTGKAHIDVTEGLEPATNYKFNVSLRESITLLYAPVTSVSDIALLSCWLQ